jgi:Uri superfamily endonuclease
MPLMPDPGTYALILRGRSRRPIQIGRWGPLDVDSRCYIYVGSAFGPGGVKARLLRHYRRKKRRHWHIDYLREHTSFVHAWISYEVPAQEHRWAATLAALPGVVPVKGFGCSDCRCHAHLFSADAMPNPAAFARAIGRDVEVWR